MANENLQLATPNCVRVEGYFYHIPAEADALFKKTDDGTNAFSYPLDTDITNPVESLEHDGYFFWTLENPAGDDIIIRKWEIDDFILKLVRTYNLNGSPTQVYDANAFAVEHFETTFSGAVSSGNDLIEPVDKVDRVSVGDHFILGPSTFPGDEGKTEEIVVLEVVSGTHVRFNSNMINSYNPGDPISFATNVWIFNKFQPSDPDPINGSGQLFSFKITDISTTVVPRKAGNEFNGVLAATYLEDTLDSRDYLVYMNQTNLLFLETQSTDSNYLLNVKSASQNNQETDTTVIPVHEITHENKTLFRLQQKATFKTGAVENTEDWTPDYNYQLSTLERLPRSISLTADQAIISADGVSTTDITAIVKDQFDEPLSSRTVNFSDNDSSGADPGFVAPTSAVTNANGEAFTTYEAGTEPKVVTITAET
jgi:hypothetical protein